MKRFSERIGITKQYIQIDDINQSLQNFLWNAILLCFVVYEPSDLKKLCNTLALNFFRIPLDEIRDLGVTPLSEIIDRGTLDRGELEGWIKKKFYSLRWYEVYDFIEFLVRNEGGFDQKDFQEILNYTLEDENSGYRLVSGVFSPIINEQEIKEIEEAIEKAAKVGIEGAREHLSSALSLLAKKPEPDYRNSIKESISAVESVAKQVSGEHGGGLDKALEELSKKAEIHGALKQGFLKLYGYASDEDGIRHAILEDPNVGFDEAKFMLVSCSAFVNLLFSKAQKAGLLKEG